MKKHIVSCIWLVLFAVSLYYAYIYGVDVSSKVDSSLIKYIAEIMLLLFISGVSISAFIFNIIYSKTTTSLNMYKRELEKESIDSTESSSRIKVLESKIKVLEKALDDALNR